MSIIQSAIRYPVTTTVGVILLVLFGVVSLTKLPELGYTVIVLANYGHAATPVADYLRQLIAHSK